MILQVKELSKSYGKKLAVNKISFSVEEGQIFALLGPNGAGKTTTLKCILGLRKEDSGKIYLGGTYAYLPEKKELYKYLTVEKMIEITQNISKMFRKEKAVELINDFKISLKEKIANLSHGMLTQVYISLVFAEDVDIYFLDEPTWGLDPLMRSKVIELVRKMSLEGKTIVYTSHILPEVEKVADVVAIMNHGKILELDFLDNLKEKYVACVVGKNENVEGYLFKETEKENVYITLKEKAIGKIEPVTFENIFEAIVRTDKRTANL
ncbi:ABC transporter ATP-binding protein [Thermosipho ferrireducens]|uniref:ABC transporter ATP-binding protein n=1 Tax=Thermosipho ferrireducens TaxID=2571116 RepID=A0ABX7S4E4_9BACT|nr:ABC transporter ATP-binding protein [Thermosipho ferrireducens]QTA37272.1 ABC transporter ATP-binding protein [Thermosipho ferrireducens]